MKTENQKLQIFQSKNTQNRSLSFIIPAMNEEETLETLYQGIRKQASKLSKDWEVIFIDDGSTDSTWDVMRTLAETQAEHVRALRFRHNRGKADALALGYQESQNDIIFTMDADLQDDPNEIPRFLKKLDEGYDLISGYKKKRHDPWHKVLPSRVFNAILSRLVDVHLHDHNCGFKVYRREVIDTLDMYGDMHRMVPSLASFNGFKTGEIVILHHPRLHGESKYGWGRIAIGLMDMMTVSFIKRFRYAPMHYAGQVAVALFALGSLFLIIAGASSLSGHHTFAPILISTGTMILLSGLLSLNQGLILETSTRERMQNRRQLPVVESLNPKKKLPSHTAALPSSTKVANSKTKAFA